MENAYICVLFGQIVCNFCCNIENLEHISTIKHFLVLFKSNCFRFINNMFNLIRLSSQPLYYVSVKVVPVVDIVRYTYYIYTIK